ncbi:hypothetical protein LQZ18_04660 [Lachnospiraceae bacterium ZAX-1]
MVVKLFCYAYLIYIVSVIFHECMHVLCAILSHIKINSVIIGNFIFLHIKKLAFSPLIFSGYVDVDYENLIGKRKITISIFYLSGIVGNFLLLLFSLLIIDNFLLRLWAVLVNGISIASSALPIVENNDVFMLFSTLKRKKNIH